MKTAALFLTALALSLSFFSRASLVGFDVEVVTYHDGMVGDYDLTGFVTYRVYAIASNPDDFLTNLAAFEGCVDTPFGEVCDGILSLEGDCAFFKHPFGSPFGGDMPTEMLWDIAPALEYSSYITIGLENQDQMGTMSSIFTDDPNPVTSWCDSAVDGFTTAPGFLAVDGGVFTTNSPSNPNGLFGPDLRILIAQFTTCGDWSFNVAPQIIENGEPGQFSVEPSVVFNPCTNFLGETTLEDPLCFGDENGSISVGTSSLFSSELLSDDGLVSENNTTGVFDDLPGGDYLLYFESTHGCLDTVDTSLIIPDLFNLDVNLTQDNLCFGVFEAAFDSVTVGGIGDISLSFDNTGDSIADGIAQPLTGGNYIVIATDDNGCDAFDDLTVSAIAPFEIELTAVDVDCSGNCNGQLVANITGGVGEIAGLWIFCDGNTSTSLTISDLCACGTYTFTATDANMCTATASYDMQALSEITLDVVSTPSACSDDNTGSISVTISGGTPNSEEPLYTIASSPEIDDFDAVATGGYTITVSDANDCSVNQSVEVGSPDPIEAISDVSNATCTGMMDGGAEVLVQGGTAPFQLVSEQIEFESADATFSASDLSDGVYYFTVLDDNHCTLSDSIIVGATIPSDFSIEGFSSPETCFGEEDGTATVATTGGEPPYTIQWSDPAGQTTFTAIGLDVGPYTVSVSDALGCSFEDLVEVLPTEDCLFVANAVTPNGDGDNDNWFIGGLEYFPESEVFVYNRWGQLLFESKGYGTAWDGTYKSDPLPVADYYYIIDYRKDREPLTGTVTVKY